MKAGSSDVVDVVAETGGTVAREEIQYQIEEHKGLELPEDLLDQMVRDGELEPNGEGFTLPDAFDPADRPKQIKERDRSRDLDSNELPEEEVGEFGYPPRTCKRCGREYDPDNPTGKICPDCDLRKQQPKPPDPPPPEPEEEPPAEPEEPEEEGLGLLDFQPIGEIFGARGVPARQDRRGKGKGWTDEEIIERIQLYAELTGAPPTKLDLNPAKLMKAAEKHRTKAAGHVDRLAFYREGDWPSEAALRDHFGTFSAALVAAGFDARAPGRQPVGKVPTRPAALDGEALTRLWERLEEIRSAGSPEDIRSALYDLGAAALTEADRIGK